MENQALIASEATTEAELFQLDMQDFGPGYSYQSAASLCACISCSCMQCFCGCSCIDYIAVEDVAEA